MHQKILDKSSHVNAQEKYCRSEKKSPTNVKEKEEQKEDNYPQIQFPEDG